MRRYLIPILVSELVAGGSALAAGPVPIGAFRIGGSRIVEPERQQTDTPDNGRFDPKAWAAPGGYSLSRLEMFNRLLREYDLIGMEQEEVLRLLGIGSQSRPADYKGGLRSIAHWVTRTNGCTPEGMSLKIQFKNGAVDSWCFVRVDNKELSPPITSNVLLSEPYPKGDFRFIRISSTSLLRAMTGNTTAPMAAAKTWWPATIPKNTL
jgi:hypothetical protein